MPTRAALEYDIIIGNRLSTAMARVGLDVSTSGVNIDMNSALRDALIAEGRSPADPIDVADIDFATLSGPSLARFRVVATLRIVERMIDLVELDDTASRDAATPFLAALRRRREALIEEVRRPIRPADAPAVGQYTGHCNPAYPHYPDRW